MMKAFEFVKGATNVYRTEQYIVKQLIEIRGDQKKGLAIVSHDTFFRRTARRDAEYELMFFMRDHIDGRRLPSTMYNRKYIL